jgi:hypothetical protein
MKQGKGQWATPRQGPKDLLQQGVQAMKINTLLTTSVLLTVGASSECARGVVTKISEFVDLLGLLAPKLAGDVSFYTWLVSSVLVLARTALCDGSVIAFAVLHAAMWLAKIFVLAAVFSGCAN